MSPLAEQRYKVSLKSKADDKTTELLFLRGTTFKDACKRAANLGNIDFSKKGYVHVMQAYERNKEEYYDIIAVISGNKWIFAKTDDPTIKEGIELLRAPNTPKIVEKETNNDVLTATPITTATDSYPILLKISQ